MAAVPVMRGGRRPGRAAAALAVAAALLTASACGASPVSDGAAGDAVAAADGRPLALVYRGPAACEGCPEAARELLERDGFAVRYVGPEERLRFGAGVLAGAALYVQPGGTNGQEVSTAWGLLQRDPGFSPELVRDYVRGGGRYLGLCMGGYLAGDPGYDLLPGDSGQYIRSRGATVTDEQDRLVDVAWRGRPQRMYFQDGPYFDVDGPGVDVLARYSNDRAAAVIAPYGSGRVAVSGPHPEAPADWYRDYHLPDESKTGLGLGDDLLHDLMAAPAS
ncbi:MULTISPECIES: BPL-N domain-containing protein [unclassified Kitasatospora]|uniref:BPL-N domain-containing protein n=1 Tax=unclassified Kitasatospora TaxID=2633591 RepID=UPI00342FCA91